MEYDFEPRQPRKDDAIAINWAEFAEFIPTEGTAVDVLYHLLIKILKRGCSFCLSNKLKRSQGSRKVLCEDCKNIFSFTAGTFFHSVKRIRPWLAAFWLLERGLQYSVNRFSKMAEVAYGTAWFIHKRLDFVTNKGFESCSALSVLSSDFLTLFRKRSRETPARQHPVFEQDVIESEQGFESGDVDDEREAAAYDDSPADNLADDEAQVLKAFSDLPISVEKLADTTGLDFSSLSAAISMLEIMGLIKSIDGTNYVRAFVARVRRQRKSDFDKQAGREPIFTVTNFIGFVKFCLRGIARKYLQFHLAKFWCINDVVKWGSGSLFLACVRHERVLESDILNYNSPFIVQLPTMAV